ncbi:uncharacterized protein LOC143366794 [Andrena cerasifolii]|uniref:uncharacterized protein LOC143366794 n=1 Tax=Andrena cerasifolii TaxID=2819439 RepID=UPI00403823D2
MSKKTTYKWCFVPECKSTTIKTPDKVFFFMPQDVKLRKMWFTSARRADEPGKSNYYCCQDHFDLKNDMDNYVRYSLMGAPRKLKSGVIPHIFDCQPGRLKTSVNLSRPTFVKLNRKRTVAEMLSNTDSEKENSCQSTHTSKKQAVEDNATLNNPAKKMCTDLNNRASTSYEVFVNKSSRSKEESNSEEDILESTANFSYTQNLASSSSHVSHAHTHTVTTNTGPNCKKTSVLSFGESSGCLLPKSIGKKTVLRKSIGVQVYQKLVKPHVRSKATMCVPSTSDASCQCKIEDKTSNSDQSTSSVSHLTSDYKISSEPSEYQQSTTCSEEEKEKNKQMKMNVLNMTRYFISIDSKKYIGIGTEWLWIIDLIHSYIKCSIDDIKLTLMKIKTDDSFSRLGNEFGLSTSQASRVFNKTVNLISQCLKKLVYCPSPEHIKKKLTHCFSCVLQ